MRGGELLWPDICQAGNFGGYKDVPGGQSDPECTHVILTQKEYDQISRRRRERSRKSVVQKYEC